MIIIMVVMDTYCVPFCVREQCGGSFNTEVMIVMRMCVCVVEGLNT